MSDTAPILNELKQLLATEFNGNESNPSGLARIYKLLNDINPQGRHDEARSLDRLQLALKEKLEEEDRANAAANLSTQSKFEAEEHLYSLMIAINTRLFGEVHRETAKSINGLASSLDEQGRYNEGEPLLRKVLDINTSLFDEEHPNTATSINNLASNLGDQGRNDEAELLYRKALEINKKLYGEEHPETAKSLANLAANLSAQGRYDESEPLYRTASDIYEKLYGKNNPETDASLASLAAKLRAQGLFESDKDQQISHETNIPSTSTKKTVVYKQQAKYLIKNMPTMRVSAQQLADGFEALRTEYLDNNGRPNSLPDELDFIDDIIKISRHFSTFEVSNSQSQENSKEHAKHVKELESYIQELIERIKELEAALEKATNEKNTENSTEKSPQRLFAENFAINAAKSIGNAVGPILLGAAFITGSYFIEPTLLASVMTLKK